MTNQEKAIDKVRKLLAMGDENSGASQNEIDQAIAAAERILAQHQLTREDVTQAEDGSWDASKVEYSKRSTYSFGANLTQWQADLGHFICDFLGTVKWYRQTGRYRRVNPNDNASMLALNEAGRTSKANKLTFYGPDEDCEAAADLFTELQHAIATMGQLYHGGWARGSGASYCEGFVNGLERAHQKSQGQLTSGEDKYALVVQEKSLAIRKGADHWLAESQGVKLRQGGSRSCRSNFDSSAFLQGKKHGGEYDVNKPAGTKKLS